MVQSLWQAKMGYLLTLFCLVLSIANCESMPSSGAQADASSQDVTGPHKDGSTMKRSIRLIKPVSLKKIRSIDQMDSLLGIMNYEKARNFCNSLALAEQQMNESFDSGIRNKKSPFEEEGIRYKKSPFLEEGIRYKKSPFDEEGIRYKKAPFDDEGIRFKKSPFEEEGIRYKKSPFDGEGIRY